jgi:hypothetical protein
VSWIERAVEERLAQAARGGELSVPHLEGKPIADLDRQRGQGWWADQFVQRELSHDRAEQARAAASAARAQFWRAESVEQLTELVAAANQHITTANLNLVAADQLPRFDIADIERRWRELAT